MVVKLLMSNAEKARALIKTVVPLLAGHAGPCRNGCQTTLDHALITAPEQRDPAMVAKLDAVAGRVLKT
jgi:5'-methylthioadenosine phosphorylase